MTESEKKEKLVLIKKNGVEILSENLFNKISKGNLSASMTNSLLACPADWMLDKYILPLIEHDEQPALERGTLFHSIMELFFRIPAGERTAQQLAVITKEETRKSHPHFMSDEETKTWIKDAVRGYLSMGFDFNDEIVPTLTVDDKPKYGLELFIKGNLGETKRPIVGFIDKLIEKEENGKKLLIMEDWKTGKKVHPYTPDKPISSNNSFDYWRQQTLYAMLLEQKGVNVDVARLIFPVAKKIVNVEFYREDVQQQVIKDMETVDKLLDKCLSDNFFPFTPAVFCTWCHLFYAGRKKGRPRFPKVNQLELNEIIEIEDD